LAPDAAASTVLKVIDRFGFGSVKTVLLLLDTSIMWEHFEALWKEY
jgi:hypothetical protein